MELLERVEFVPNINLKTGIKYGVKNFLSNIQLAYLSNQFTDSSNAIKGNMSGIIGEIPEYLLLDISFSFKYKKVKAEAGINNLLNEDYFTEEQQDILVQEYTFASKKYLFYF